METLSLKNMKFVRKKDIDILRKPYVRDKILF